MYILITIIKALMAQLTKTTSTYCYI